MSERTLTIVVPVFNQARELPGTLDAAAAAVVRTRFVADVVVVDDGSTDGSGDVASSLELGMPVRVVRQSNRGRFAARRAGLAAAEGELVLFLDSRVRIGEAALSFVESELDADPERAVWNAHVTIETEGNPYGVFWDVVTQRAFSTYFDDPRTTSFGADEFDLFPKGTTCFLAPRADLAGAFAAHRSGYDDERYGNDDTPIIRRLAESRRIHISPRFGCTYQPRRDLRGFVRHAFHRGIVFLDGHGRRGTRLYPAVVAFYPVSAAWAAAALRVRVLAVAPFVLAALAGGVAARSRGTRDAAAAAALAPVYAASHGAGMWRGLLMLVRSRMRRRGA